MSSTSPRNAALAELIAPVRARVAERFDSDLERVRRFLRIPSVSATGEGIGETAAHLRDWMEAAGGDAQLLDTGGHPLVLGHFEGPAGAPRLLRYGMYDVQPAEEPDWSSPPFGAELRELPGVGPAVVGRGTANSKSTLAAQLIAIEIARELGGLPVGIVYMVEGEEELGSPNLPSAVARYNELLQADAAFDLDVGADVDGACQIVLGCKGLLSLEVTVEAGPWGGPGRSLHSSEQAWIASPVWELVRALATLIDDNQDLAVAALRDAAPPPTPGDEKLLAALARDWDLHAHLEHVRTARYRVGGDAHARLRELLFKPSINIDGIAAGYVGPGGKTIIPSSARAMLDIRLVPGLDPRTAEQMVRRHLDERGLSHVQTRVPDAYPPGKAEPGNPVARALDATIVTIGRPALTYPLAPWCAPYHVFDQLKLDWAVGNIGHGAGAHGPDEYVTIAGLREHIAATVLALHAFSLEPVTSKHVH